MKIYFEDGELCKSVQLPITTNNLMVIDAMEGVSKNIRALDNAKKRFPTPTIYTNSIFAFSNTYASVFSNNW